MELRGNGGGRRQHRRRLLPLLQERALHLQRADDSHDPPLCDRRATHPPHRCRDLNRRWPLRAHESLEIYATIESIPSADASTCHFGGRLVLVQAIWRTPTAPAMARKRPIGGC